MPRSSQRFLDEQRQQDHVCKLNQRTNDIQGMADPLRLTTGYERALVKNISANATVRKRRDGADV
jgi:hypothetical protein